MNAIRSITSPWIHRRRKVFRVALLMSLVATGSASAFADQTIKLPPPVAGSNQPVLILSGIESASIARAPIAAAPIAAAPIAAAQITTTSTTTSSTEQIETKKVESKTGDAQPAHLVTTLQQPEQPKIVKPSLPAIPLIPAVKAKRVDAVVEAKVEPAKSADEANKSTDESHKIEVRVIAGGPGQLEIAPQQPRGDRRDEPSGERPSTGEARDARGDRPRGPAEQPRSSSQRSNQGREAGQPNGGPRGPGQRGDGQAGPSNRGPEQRGPEQRGQRDDRPRDPQPLQIHQARPNPQGPMPGGPPQQHGPQQHGPEQHGPVQHGPQQPGGPQHQGPQHPGPNQHGPNQPSGPQQHGPQHPGPQPSMLIPPQQNAGEAHGFSMGQVPGAPGQAHVIVQGFRIGDQPGHVTGSVPGMPPGASALFVPSPSSGSGPQPHGQPTTMVMRMIGPPGMDSRTHLSAGDQNPEKLFESPVFKKMLSLIEENAQLKAQLKIQAIESESRARIQELESALRSRDGRGANGVSNGNKPREEEHNNLSLQKVELENMRQKLESQRRDLERQRDEMHRQAGEVKNVQVIELKRDSDNKDGDAKNRQIEVRVLDKADFAKDVAIVQNKHKDAFDDASNKLAQSEAALKAALQTKEAMSTQLNELEHRSRLLEAKLSELAKRDSRDAEKLAAEARERAEQEKKKAEAAAREVKEKAIAKEREEREERRKAEAKRKEESRKKEESRDKEESKNESSQQDRKEE